MVVRGLRFLERLFGEGENACEDQVNGDDIVQQVRKNQHKDSCDDGHDGGKIRTHRMFFGWTAGKNHSFL